MSLYDPQTHHYIACGDIAVGHRYKHRRMRYVCDVIERKGLYVKYVRPESGATFRLSLSDFNRTYTLFKPHFRRAHA